MHIGWPTMLKKHQNNILPTCNKKYIKNYEIIHLSCILNQDQTKIKSQNIKNRKMNYKKTNIGNKKKDSCKIHYMTFHKAKIVRHPPSVLCTNKILILFITENKNKMIKLNMHCQEMQLGVSYFSTIELLHRHY